MEILSTLDQRDAINFTKIAPYVIDDDFIPAGAFEKVGISFLDAADLDSLGLIHRRMMKRLKRIPSAINKKYMVLPRNVDSFPGAPCFDLEASLLTKVGMEIYGILNLAEDEYLEGAKFFAESDYTKIWHPDGMYQYVHKKSRIVFLEPVPPWKWWKARRGDRWTSARIFQRPWTSSKTFLRKT